MKPVGMKPPCDLHLHSYYSDGDRSPAALVARGGKAGLSAVSITDHDTVKGQEEALHAGRASGLAVLTGVEFSVMEQGRQIHILGYCFDNADARLGEQASYLEEARIERARSIVRKLNDGGIRVSFDDLLRESGRGTVGRPHVAKLLMKRGVVREFQEAFDRFLGSGRPAYVPKTMLSLEGVVRIITGAGGVPVWAHPGAAIRKSSLLERLCEAGVRGVEVWHPNHAPNIEREIEGAALKRGLIMTGGSDYHFRDAMKAEVGGVSAPYETALALRKASVAARDA